MLAYLQTSTLRVRFTPQPIRQVDPAYSRCLVTLVPPPHVDLLLSDTPPHCLLGAVAAFVELSVLVADVPAVAGDGDGKQQAAANDFYISSAILDTALVTTKSPKYLRVLKAA